ncbi:MAG: prolyl oligopeptidase family serine peptidase [Caulobacteraceae bacterium]
MFNRRVFLGGASALALLRPLSASAAQAAPPVARVDPVTEDYFGTKVIDRYRWMEKADAPEFLAYLRAQGAYARTVLDAIPGRDALARRIGQFSGEVVFVTQVQAAGPYIFTQVRPAGANTYKLFVREGLDGKDRVLVDPDLLVHGDVHYALDYWVASPDGSHVAYGTSPGGGEQSILRVIETASGDILPEAIDRTQYASPSWTPDGSGFFFNRLAAGGKPGDLDYYKKSVAWFHRLRTDPDKDVKVLSYGQTPGVAIQEIDFPMVSADPSSGYVLGAVVSGVQNEIGLYVAPLADAMAGTASWTRVCTPQDQVTAAALRGTDLYLLSHKDASRYKVLKTSVTGPAVATAALAVPPGQAVIRGMLAAKDAIYLVDLDHGLGQIRRLTPDGATQVIPLPFKGSISSPYADTLHDGMWFVLESWVRPSVLCRVGADGVVVQTDVLPKPPIDLSAYASVEVEAKAHDGVMVPLSIVYRKDTPRDGSAPCLLEAYGSYGVTEDPAFAPRDLAFLDQGGIYAVAHVRGGGELGEDWHLAGKKLTKPNTWRDDIACAEYLIAHKWTRPSKLAATGTSAGGITIGRFLTERPDLLAVAIPRVGVSDAMRSEFSPNGPPNVPEFGTVKDASDFKGLLEMDAYQHVRDGVRYPAVLLTTGLNDPRVAPWEPGKMAARLQAATRSGKPVILRVEADAGHGLGSTRRQADEEWADIFSFILWQTGDPRFQPKAV